ncbi:MAG: amino acid ABC transporter permease [Steroidobacteraceae bacterium]
MMHLIETYGLYFLVGQYPNGPLGGLVLTLILASLGLLLALPLGVAFGLGRISPLRWIRWPVSALVLVVRSTPLLMVVFWAYFFLPSLTGVKTGQFSTMLIALVLFDGAFIAEIIRAGIQGLPPGQSEAARALGMSYFGALRYVVMPQALRAMLPSLVNQFVVTIKDTTLGYIIGLQELVFVTSQINSLEFTKPAQIYLICAATYFLLCFGLSRLAFWLERRLSASGSARRAAAAQVPA